MYPKNHLNISSQEDHFTKRKGRTSGQDGGLGRHTTPPHTTKKKDNKFKNKKQPELTENLTV